MVACDRCPLAPEGPDAVPGECSGAAVVEEGGDDEVDRLTLSSVVDGVIPLALRTCKPSELRCGTLLGPSFGGVVAFKSMVDTLAAGGSSQRDGTLAALVSVCKDLFWGVGAGSRMGLVFRLFENLVRFRLRAANAPKP